MSKLEKNGYQLVLKDQHIVVSSSDLFGPSIEIYVDYEKAKGGDVSDLDVMVMLDGHANELFLADAEKLAASYLAGVEAARYFESAIRAGLLTERD